MRIAFYAPLKSPRHPVPSGDRLLGRMFIAALEHAGHEVTVASHLRSWDGSGDAERQRRLARIGRACADRLIRRWQHDRASAPELWFTYHVYHKAPDWIGPAVSAAFAIPYVIAEGSVARKQCDGRWREGHAAAEAAIRIADAAICINPADIPGVAAVRDRDKPPLRLAPFLDVERFVASAVEGASTVEALCLPQDSPRLVAIAMMRPGDKLASYRALAAALSRLADRRWHLVVVGDGEARTQVETAFAMLDTGRVRFVGRQPAAFVSALLQTSALLTWPAVTEPIGMVLLEAQACGVPIVAGRRPGSSSVVDDGASGVLVPPGDEAAFAEAVDGLLAHPERRAAMAKRASAYAREEHDLPIAAEKLDAIVTRVARAHRRTTPS